MPQAFGTRIIAASDAQIHANRLSARRSTGPQTENGKRADRYNALKHGLLAEASLLPGEDAALFRLLAEEGASRRIFRAWLCETTLQASDGLLALTCPTTNLVSLKSTPKLEREAVARH